MSETIKNIWRKVTNGLSLSTLIPALLIVAISFFALVTIKGVILSVCWNIAITSMFGLPKITIFQAFLLFFTVACLRADYLSTIELGHKKIKSKISDKLQEENIANALSVFLIILLTLVSISIVIGLTMFTWNNILPSMLNLELYKINFIQAFGFAYIFNCFFGISISTSDNSISDKNTDINNEIVIEDDNDMP